MQEVRLLLAVLARRCRSGCSPSAPGGRAPQGDDVLDIARLGFMRIRSRMPELSSWNTPTRSRRAPASRRSAGRPAAAPPCRPRRPLGEQLHALVFSTVSVFRPRKSNFTSPAFSTSFMLNWVTGMSERGSRYSGTSSIQRPVADHHAGGVGRGVAVEPFQLERDVEHGCRGLVGFGAPPRSAVHRRWPAAAVSGWPDCWAPACTAGPPGHRASAARGRRRAAPRAPAAFRR
jgi:hypothetical protein